MYSKTEEVDNVFLMSYLIGRRVLKYIKMYDRIREKFSYPGPINTYKQIKHYAL